STIASTPATLSRTARFMRALSADLCSVWKPGVSTKMNCAVAVVRIPRMRCRVVCGRLEVMLIRAPTRPLISVDLPTLGRPTTATSPQRKSSAAADSAARRLLIGARRRGLRGGAAARAGAARSDAERRDAADDLEGLQVRLAAYADDRVLGDRKPPSLQPFLQQRLRILADAARVSGGELRGVDALD